MAWVAALGIWVAGIPVFYSLDRDPTGTRGDRLRDAAAWPFLMVILAVIGTAWAIGKVYQVAQPPTIRADRLAE